MNNIAKVLGIFAPLALIATTSIATPASAISVDLAKNCRDMAIKAHPPTVPGAKKGSAEAERTSYQSCIKNNGNGSNDDTQKDASSPAK